MPRASLEALARELLCENAELKRRNKEMTRRHEELALRHEELLLHNEELSRRVVALERELAAAKKDSSTSSRPPSGDTVRPTSDDIVKGRKSRSGRQRGGQPGHSKHERTAFPPDRVDRVETYSLTACPDCGGKLRKLNNQSRVMQQAEFVAAPIEVAEHRREAYSAGPNVRFGDRWIPRVPGMRV